MSRTRKRAGRGRGFTLIELVVVVSIIGILAVALLDRMMFYQEQAEKAAMEQTVGIIRSALHLKMAALIVKGKTDQIPLLVKENPMDWLAEKPKNYLGKYFAPKPQDIESGNWYFDFQSGNLIYLPRNNKHFVTKSSGQDRILFRTSLVTAFPGQGSETENLIEGVTFDPVVPYEWF